jgi:hypothetical protein
MLAKIGEIKIGNNDSNKSKFDSGGSQEEIEFW